MDFDSEDIFNGKFSVDQAIQQFRTRLLDLTARNRLISYRHPKGRSIQFVDDPVLNVVFNRLIDNKSILIKSVPNPPADLFAVKRPDAKAYAKTVHINVSEEFLVTTPGLPPQRQSAKLQALFYPDELEKICRKLRSESNTVIEETGTNMLYLIFGFLEYYENEESDKPILAPLLSLPVTLEKGDIDPETRTYQYTINYSGEDVQHNESLREKLSREFMLQLPIFEEEGEPESYFAVIQGAVQMRKRWRVRSQLTLGFLSFGKLAIWADLNPQKWPKFAQSKLLNQLFSGHSGSESDEFGEDYEIDNHPETEALSLIFDADSAQHSAIIDVLAGKNRVINGPPGTGKSQTITNIIAAALQKGKKVLFVSEKLAALEVVRHRLNQANLGHFCLELHSHKTQKKKLLEDLQKRRDETFATPRQIEDRLATLNQQKQVLNTYAQLISSRIGNKLGLTAHEVFWKAEFFRGLVRQDVFQNEAMLLPEASEWTLADIELRRSKLNTLGKLMTEAGPYNSSNPWWGFKPYVLAPGTEMRIQQLLKDAMVQSQYLDELVQEYISKTKLTEEPSLQRFKELHSVMLTLPEPPPNLVENLLPCLFPAPNVMNLELLKIVRQVVKDIRQANQLKMFSIEFLTSSREMIYTQIHDYAETASKQLIPTASSLTLIQLNELVKATVFALDHFDQQITIRSYAYHPINLAILRNLDKALADLNENSPLKLEKQSIKVINQGVTLLTERVDQLAQCYERIDLLVHQLNVNYDGSLTSIQALGRLEGIKGLRSKTIIDESVLENIQAVTSQLPIEFAKLSLTELQTRKLNLVALHERIDDLLTNLKGYAQQLSFPFNGSSLAISSLSIIAELAAEAPHALIDFRHPALAHPRIGDLIRKGEEMQFSENKQREKLAEEVYFDALPNQDELKGALRSLRQTGDGFFNFLNKDWRSAKKLVDGISRDKIKGKAINYQNRIEQILKWQDCATSINSNPEFKEAFGLLFKGVDTDFSAIRRLHEWYKKCQIKVHQKVELAGMIDLATLETEMLMKYAALAPSITEMATALDDSIRKTNHLLYRRLSTLAQEDGWTYNRRINQVINTIANLATKLEQFVTPDISPERSVELLTATLEIRLAKEDFELLTQVVTTIRTQVEPLLPGLATMECQYVDQYIRQLNTIIIQVNHLLDQVVTFVHDHQTNPEEMRLFMDATCKVEACVTELLNTDPITTNNWPSYSSHLQSQTNAIGQLVSSLLSVAKSPEQTVQDTLEALQAQNESEVLVQQITEQVTGVGLPDGLIEGLNTNVDALEATIDWSQNVVMNPQIFRSELQHLFKSADASSNFLLIKKILDKVAALPQKIEDCLTGLANYGHFSWAEWSQTVMKRDSSPYASLLHQRTQSAVFQVDKVLVWSQYYSNRTSCLELQLQPFVDFLEDQTFPAEKISDVFHYAVYWSIAKHIYTTFPVFNNFVGTRHDSLRSEFAALDREIIQVTGKAFAYQIDRNKEVPSGLNSLYAREKTQRWLLEHEIAKQKRHIPIRQLIKRAGKALQEYKPCFMMGPLSVAQYLELGAVEFDLIVMDEASQLRPEEALGAIARGKQLVVVGDPKQLPPTNFFDRIMDGDDDEEDATPDIFGGLESILDICQQLFHPVRTLRWHYRSQHESLIAFSNHHFYDGKLIVFPSPYDRNKRLGVRYRYLKNGEYKDRRNIVEAQRVVEAVIEHMIHYPDESLGVVTLNQTQRDLIDDLLDKKMRDSQETASYLEKWRSEGLPFFIKNLENVQGDERDVIFISTTFGKVLNTDKVRQNFGPISRSDGWRRLNVLFTRARRKIDLFTSLLPEDILSDEKTPRGTRALRDYLDFAKNGLLTSANPSGREADSDFERSVGEMLQNHGYDTVPQLGVAGFFIDIAIRNPDRPGEFLAAVECDGATYHSSKSARDRDRIRQTILESLGWKNRIWRIWSTDWFYNPRRESERLLTFLKERREAARLEPIYIDDEPDEDDYFGDDLLVQVVDSEIADSLVINSREEIYVEVGDKITFSYSDRPSEKRTVMLVEGASDPKHERFNDQSSLGKALLNAKVGEVKLLENNALTRRIKVLKISR
ncbi:DUF4011 domain-containing protein [Larkinella sp. C7]|uniref:DUF4011 domain-containing protein n=1 Tax=Larkinella sp. C7 TaxID=2576607 RepID=UPI0011112C2D|nr:DUF4011 domain-containing protein [Larkinella sp. C7]